MPKSISNRSEDFFKIEFNEARFSKMSDVEQLGDNILIDTRVDKEYSGESVRNKELAPGHIPHAVHIFFKNAL